MKKLTDQHADATRCVHAGEERHGQAAPLTTPIAQTSVFVVPEVEGLRRYAKGDSGLYLYSRYGNPTVAAAEAEDCRAGGRRGRGRHLQRNGGGAGCGAGGVPGG